MELAEGETLRVKGSAPDPYVLAGHGSWYSCTCPAWQFQKGPLTRRTCKHLKGVLGAAAEEARVREAEARAPRRRKPQRTPPRDTITDDAGREYELDD